MSTATQLPWGNATAMAALHACRSQVELEEVFGDGLAVLLPGMDVALCLAEEEAGKSVVRIALGDGCPVAVGDVVAEDCWPVPEAQRLAIRFGDHQLGQLLLGGALPQVTAGVLRDAVTHFGTALINLTLNTEAVRATNEYCATLQALEEGIVLFQEADPEAVTARLLHLASTLVNATAGALYVLEEVGNVESPLVLNQALGIPDALLESFRSKDGSPWPEQLLDGQVEIALVEQDGGVLGLDPDCVPPVLRSVVVLPLRYHGVHSGVCLLFNPGIETVLTQEESGRLQSFGQLAAALLHRLSLERLREDSVSIQRELQIAETIQQRLVPTEAPSTGDYEFAWRSLAAKSIGGDYVDFLMSDLGDLYLIVADASGHGINSALLMTSFRANYRGRAAWLEPNDLAAELNEEIVHEVGPTGMFITAAMARITGEGGQLSISSAGHNPTMIYRRATGEVEQVDSDGPPLGFMAGMDYGSYEGQLDRGDVLLLYTDGITEATDASGTMFGEDRLCELLRATAAGGGTAQQVMDAAMHELATFTGRALHDDDVSMLVVRARSQDEPADG